MRPLYADVSAARALVVDGNPSLRSMQAMMLRDMGVGSVVQASKASDARRLLESRSFDIVLCDYHFDTCSMTGQDLVDELRRTNQLPHATVFIMVTGEASYAHVAEAAEAALDSYLLKPHTAKALEQRLMQSRHRKLALHSVYAAIDAGEFQTAASLCRTRFDARDPYWLHAARIGAELSIRLGDHAAARRLYEAVHETKALPWARLGLARAEVAAGQLTQAATSIAALLGDQPHYADAYDVMGRVQMEQGQLEAALETYRVAARITPHNVARLQKQGLLAYYLGAADEATQALDRSVRLGLESKAFDCQSLLLLALMHHDQGNTKAYARNHDNLLTLQERRPEDLRLGRLVMGSEVLRTLAARQVGPCVAHLRELVASSAADDVDFEAAGNLLAILTRLRTSEIQLPDSDGWVTTLARRFCSTKATADLLCRVVAGHAPHVDLVRAGHAHIGALAEQAMARNRSGAPADALHGLIAAATETRNTKLVDLAGKVLARHAAALADPATIGTAIEHLRRRLGMASDPQ